MIGREAIQASRRRIPIADKRRSQGAVNCPSHTEGARGEEPEAAGDEEDGAAVRLGPVEVEWLEYDIVRGRGRRRGSGTRVNGHNPSPELGKLLRQVLVVRHRKRRSPQIVGITLLLEILLLKTHAVQNPY